MPYIEIVSGEVFIEKVRKLYAAFMDVEKAYDKVDREDMTYLRSECRITLGDRMMNVEVCEQCGVGLDVLESVKKNTLRWFGHVECT